MWKVIETPTAVAVFQKIFIEQVYARHKAKGEKVWQNKILSKSV